MKYDGFTNRHFTNTINIRMQWIPDSVESVTTDIFCNVYGIIQCYWPGRSVQADDKIDAL